MNDNIVANDFLKMLTNKAEFNPANVNNTASTPEAVKKASTIDKYDIAEYIKTPIIRSLVNFVGDRMAAKYEHERIKEFLERIKANRYTKVAERKTIQSKLSAITAENGIREY